MNTDRPRVKYAERPIRIWDNERKRNVARRYYVDLLNAHNGALQVARWDLRIGESITVYNARRPGVDLGTYKRTAAGVRVPDISKPERRKK